MKGRIVLLVLAVAAATAFGADRYLVIAAREDYLQHSASQTDRGRVKSKVRRVVGDPQDVRFTNYVRWVHVPSSNVWRVLCIDVGGRRFNFGRRAVSNFFASASFPQYWRWTISDDPRRSLENAGMRPLIVDTNAVP